MNKSSFLILVGVILFLNITDVCLADSGNEIDVTFEILTNTGSDEYYVGDYFWYNITLFNSGNTIINATITVDVFNSSWGLMQGSKEYPIYLQQGESAVLYPNQTSLRTENEVGIFHFDASGTYSILISSETPITYFRYYGESVFRYEKNHLRYTFDVMPRYLRTQNERWNEFLLKNEGYMNQVDGYIQESRNGAIDAQNLSYVSVFIAVSSVVLSAIGLLWDMEEKKQRRPLLYYVTMFLIVVIIVFLVWFFILLF